MNLRPLCPIAIALTVIVAVSGCGRGSISAATGPDRASPVSDAAASHRPLRERSEFTGRLEAAQAVEIRPRVGGYIDRVEFVEGVRVKKGQVLFRIDPRPFRAEAERQLAARTRALAELDLAKANHARAQRLIGDHDLSRDELERLSSADSVAASDLAAATAALSAAKLDLQFTEVRAPIDGRVSRALITRGKWVTSESLLTTVAPDELLYASVDAEPVARGLAHEARLPR